ncbi:MAG: hypothetical protein IJ584_05825 [Bacteroidales bacterium]|nr:hypothetical protein [Bacteroidales bacterium]
MDKHYISGYATRTALPRNKRMREAGITALSAVSSSPAGSEGPDWFIAQGDGSLRLNPRYSGLWTDGFLSALGVGPSSGGSGGGADLSDVWESLRTNSDDFADEKIDWGHINLSVATEGTGNVVSGLTLTKNGTSATLTAQFMNISSWALASQKPTYSYTEIQGLSEILAEKASVSWVSPEPASGNEAGLTVNGVTKTLLKSSAIEYSDKAVGLISETDFRSALNTFFPIP